MLRKRKGQSTVEYALIIGVIVAALVGMQTFVKRGLQARYHDGIGFLTTQTSEIGSTNQYEPYYSDSNYAVTQARNENEAVADRGKTTKTIAQDDRTREIGGFEQSKDTNTAD